jgi:hypothetical protein
MRLKDIERITGVTRELITPVVIGAALAWP